MLEFRNVTFGYGGRVILRNLSFTLPDGKILAVTGPSGCGKTTLLRLAAGLETPDAGTVLNRAGRIAYAFQEPRLFPWLTVGENVRAVLERTPDADRCAARALADVGLADAAALFPDQLSGGMRSRVSLARALAAGGDLFLLDEPFASLDGNLREELLVPVQRRIRESGASALFVTHQPEDAERFADEVLTLDRAAPVSP